MSISNHSDLDLDREIAAREIDTGSGTARVPERHEKAKLEADIDDVRFWWLRAYRDRPADRDLAAWTDQ